MKAALAAQINKTDRNDARGIAQMMRVGLYRPVHVKSEASQEKRTLLAARKLLQGQNRAIENDVRGLLRTFGLKVGPTSAGAFDARIRQLVEGIPRLTAIILSSPRSTRRAPIAVCCPAPHAVGSGPRRSSVPTVHDGSRRRRGRGDHLPSDGGHPATVHQLKSSWRALRLDAQSIQFGRDGLYWSHLTMRRRVDASNAL